MAERAGGGRTGPVEHEMKYGIKWPLKKWIAERAGTPKRRRRGGGGFFAAGNNFHVAKNDGDMLN